MSRNRHLERHLMARIGWLRAAVPGANDGIVATASLIVGVAAGRAGVAKFWSPVLPDWSLVPCPWRRENMCG